MVMTPQAVVFPNAASFSLTELLKIIQDAGIDPLWAEVEDGFEAVIDKAGADWGQEVRYALNVDAGGGAFGRLAQQGGAFVGGDRTRNILGKILPKYQTFTYEFERFHQKLSATQKQAYIENAKQEYLMKNAFQKSMMILQMGADGTGRQGKPTAIGYHGVEVSAGATFTLPDIYTPLKVRLSTLSTDASSPAWFLEGSMVSFVYQDLDLNDDGANEAGVGAGRCRLLTLSFDDAGAGTARAYDAFRVVQIDQEDDSIYLMPGRLHDADPTKEPQNRTFVQHEVWVDGGAGAVTVSPIRGHSVDFLAAATDTVFGASVNDLNLIFGVANAGLHLIHPLYVNQVQASARLQLGLSWAATTDISTISDGVLTGLDTLLLNTANTVHNINRASVRQYLATIKDHGNKELNFNTLYSFVAQHHNRNRARLPEWSLLSMNPITYSSMISISENDRRITEGTGVRGEEGAKYIQMNGKKFQLESHSTIRKDRVYCLADKAFTLHDGSVEKVEFGSQSEFSAIRNGLRVNVTQAYATVTGEMSVKGLRRCGCIHNFKTAVL